MQIVVEIDDAALLVAVKRAVRAGGSDVQRAFGR